MTRPLRTLLCHDSLLGSPSPKMPLSTMYAQSISITLREVGEIVSSFSAYRAHQESVSGAA